jgi:hypothetical protein
VIYAFGFAFKTGCDSERREKGEGGRTLDFNAILIPL